MEQSMDMDEKLNVDCVQADILEHEQQREHEPEREQKQKPKKMHSICIPRVDANVSKQFIFHTFCALKIGFIESVQEIPVKSDASFKRVFIRIKWNKSQRSSYFQQRFDENKNVKLVYSMPWYWICVANRHSR